MSVVPTLPEVGAINRARTVDESGDTLGTFTAGTRPTNSEATVLANLAADQVADRLGSNIPDVFAARARGAAALYAAALVEGGAREPRQALADSWVKMADDRVEQLATEIQNAAAGGEEGPVDDAHPSPVWGFPAACPLPPGS